MHLSNALYPLSWAWFAAAFGTLVLLVALLQAPWRAVLLVPERMHLIAGGSVACALLWLLNIRLSADLTVHLLGMTALTLALGWHFSVVAGAGALVLFYLVKDLDGASLPLSFLLSVVIPASLSALVARLLYRPRFRNPFFYILGAGFAGGGLVVLLLALIAWWMSMLLGLETWLKWAEEFWPILPLLMFSEGFINGMCVAALAIFYPSWMKTFDERFYLQE